MKTATFTPDLRLVGRVLPTATIETIESEPMLHGASIEFARTHGGKLTQSILDQVEKLTEPHKHYVIDTKSVMLMPDMFPAIPGWHCDGVIRQSQFDQPNLEKMSSDIKHWAALVSTHYEGVSLTEFVEETLTIPYEDGRVWGSVDHYLNTQEVKSSLVQDGQIVEFTQPTLHRATTAFNRGWRFFFRMSEYHMPPVNKIRHQVQVYALYERGW